MRFLASILLLVLLAPASLAPARAKPLDVVATTGMIADVARAVGGDEVRVRALMGPGIDPHSYRQTRSDIASMLRADLVLWNGLFLEAQMEEFLERLDGRVMVRAVAEAVPERDRIAHPTYSNRADPHVWMDPALWAHAVDRVRDTLVELRPQAAETFKANAESYKATLATLDAYAREVVASIPEDRRVLITAHDAFGYFGRAYGLEVMGVQGISTDSEAGLARIGELVDLIVERGIGAVFVESSVPERNVRALIEGAAAQGHEVAIGGELFSDAMGPAGSYEGTYPGMIDHNATVIARALGGTVPQNGMAGALATN